MELELETEATAPQETEAAVEPERLEEHLTVVMDAGELYTLDYYPNLKTVNLSSSTCYDAIVDFIEKNPQLQVTYSVDVGGTWINSLESEFTLENGKYDYELLLTNLKYLPHLISLTFPETDLTSEQVEALHQAYPETTMRCSVNILGTLYDADTTRMDLSSMTSAQAAGDTWLVVGCSSLPEVSIL